MSDTNNTPNTNDPQDLINAVLEPAPAAPTIAETPVVATPEPEVMPPELMEAPALPTTPEEVANSSIVEQPSSTVTVGDDTPLAFVGTSVEASAPTTEKIAEPTMPASLGTSAPMDAVPPVVPPSILNTPTTDKARKPSSIKKVLIAVAAFVAVLAVGGFASYKYYGDPQQGTIAYITKWLKDKEGNLSLNPQYQDLQKYGSVTVTNDDGEQEQVNQYNNEVERAEDLGLEAPTGANQIRDTRGTTKETCNGCLNGGWQVWRDGSCVTTGTCGGSIEQNTANPNIATADSAADCAKTGGSWCSSVDAKGQAYAFCGQTSETKNCNTLASEKGYIIQLGIVKCVQGDDGKYHADLSVNYATAADRYAVEAQCYAQKMGSGAYICPVGTSVACTDKNGKPFNGNLGCFCGVVQIDTGTGHTSYKSSCGCDKNETTTVNNPSPSPSTPTTPPTLMCDGLTRTPTTTPVIGDKLTFTCTGSSVPAGAVALTYKFRSAIDGGVWSSLTNKTATTAEMTINACGTYKVQCQACGTISGAVVCDPVWTGATAQ